MKNYTKKAPFNDWWYWSDVLGKRLRTVADIYRENDEKERAQEVAAISKKLYDLFIGPARKGQKVAKMSSEEKAALVKEEEAAIAEATNIWRDMLATLPFISQAVEGHLGLQWQDIDPNKADDKDKDGEGKATGSASSGGGKAPKPKKIDPRAVELLWGPKGRYDEGIRSGMAKDGGLAGILQNYLMAEKTNSNRTPTEYKNDVEFANSYGTGSALTMKPPGMSGM